jgi:membrane protein implicated in regulation of membrane protease activity
MIIGVVAIALADVAPEAAAHFTWQLQLVSFSVLAIATVFLVRRYAGRASAPSDEPGLNTRSLRYVGRVFTVAEPIVDGRGKVRVGDGLWLAEGPDLPAGTRVKVVGVNATVLIVEPVA